MRPLRTSRLLMVSATVIVGAALTAGCGSDKGSGSSASDTTVTLKAQNTTYSPTDVSVKAGEKVTFAVTNGDQIEHNLTIKDLKVDKDVKAGATEKATVTVPAGTYAFHCEYHPDQMKGTITAT